MCVATIVFTMSNKTNTALLAAVRASVRVPLGVSTGEGRSPVEKVSSDDHQMSVTMGMGVGTQIPCLGKGRHAGPMILVPKSHVEGVGGLGGKYPGHMYLLLPLCEQTTACENITFPQLHLRAVHY